MRISLAADERTGIADAVVRELREWGHEAVPSPVGELDQALQEATAGVSRGDSATGR